MDTPVLIPKKPKQSIPVNFCGKKGRSGRRTWDKEVEAKKLWDLAIPVLVYALGPNSKVDPNRKIDIALALVNKMLPSELKGEGFKGDVIIQIVKPPAESSNPSFGISGQRTSLAEADKKF